MNSYTHHPVAHEITCGPVIDAKQYHVSALDGSSHSQDLVWATKSCGGAISIQSSAEATIVAWSIAAASSTVLTLHQPGLAQRSLGKAIRLAFDAPLLPALGSVIDGDATSIYALTADSVLHRILLPSHGGGTEDETRSEGGGRDHSGMSILDWLADAGPAAIRSVHLRPNQQLGNPIGLTATAGVVCIGGSSGNILCIPCGCFASSDTTPFGDCVILPYSGGGVFSRMTRGFWGTEVAPSVVDIQAVACLGRFVIAVLHSDATLRFWDAAAALPVAASQNLSSFMPQQHNGSACLPQRLRFAATGKPHEAHMAVQFAGETASYVEQFVVHRTGQATHVASLQGPVGKTCKDVSLIAGSESVVVWLLTDAGLTVAQPTAEDQSCAISLSDHTLQQSMRQSDHSNLQGDIWAHLEHLLPHEGQAAELAARHVARLLTAPVLRCNASLAAALRVSDTQVTAAELAATGLAAQQQRVVDATLEAAITHGIVGAARQIMGAFADTWAREHEPVGLAVMPHCTGPDSIWSGPALVRLGARLGLLRSASPASAAAGSATVQSIADGVRTLLGPLTVELALAHVMDGSAADVVTHSAEILATGLLPSPESTYASPPSLQQMQSQAAWRAARRRWLLSTVEALAALRDPVAAFTAHFTRLRCTASSSAAAAAALANTIEDSSGSSFVSQSTGDVLVAAAYQEAHDAATAALTASVALNLLEKRHDFVGEKLSRHRATELHDHLPLLAHMTLLSSAVAWWTASTAVDRTSAGSTEALADPAMLIGKLHLVPAAGGGAPVLQPVNTGASLPQPSIGPDTNCSGGTLAHLYLPNFSRRYDANILRGGLDQAAFQYSAFLRHPDDHGSNEDSSSSLASLTRQVHAAAQILFEHHQLNAILSLVALVEPLASDPALQMLQGLSYINSIRLAGTEEHRANAAAAAQLPLFAAAAAFRDEADAAAPGVALARQLLHQLQQEATGGHNDEGPLAMELQYYEVVMGLLERAGAPSAAAAFATAAIHQTDRAFGSDVAARTKREGRLWANVFEYSLQASQYQEAYAAAVSNPEGDRTLEGLARLLPAMAAKRQNKAILELPLAGVVVASKAGRDTRVPVAEEVVAALERRAARLDVQSPEAPYRLLAALHLHRSAPQAAASAMVTWGRRLQTETPPASLQALRSTQLAFAAASSSLAMAAEEQQWLLQPLPPSRRPALPGGPLTPGGRAGTSPDRYLPHQGAEGSTLALPASQEAADSAEEEGSDGLSSRWEVPADDELVITLPGLRAEAAVALARYTAYSAANAEGILPPWTASDLVPHLLTLGRVEAAVLLATTALKGSALTTALEQIARQLATGAAHAQLDGLSTPESAPGSSRAAWQRLQNFLNAADSAAHGWRPTLEALRAVLAADRQLDPPPWLIGRFQKASAASGFAGKGPDPAAALRILVQYDRLESAARLLMSFLYSWDQQITDVERQQPGGAWFPPLALSQVAVALQDPSDAVSDHLRQQLQEALQRHASLVAEQSQHLKESVMA